MCSSNTCICRKPNSASIPSECGVTETHNATHKYKEKKSVRKNTGENLKEKTRDKNSTPVKSIYPPLDLYVNLNTSGEKDDTRKDRSSSHSQSSYTNSFHEASLYPSLDSLGNVSSSSSTPKASATEKRSVPLDLFVDVNRERSEETKDRPFGDAVVNCVLFSEAESSSVEQSCPRCKGWKSCIIFIPVRLGGTTMNPIYRNCIYSLFLHDLCIGIIGGKPKHSLYFVGFQGKFFRNLENVCVGALIFLFVRSTALDNRCNGCK